MNNYEIGKVSIIMPTYNRSDMLMQRIEEVELQSYPNWELIIVNDASEDDTLKKLAPYENHPRIKVISLDKNSKSVSTPRNIGISHSIGEFIVPADDDVTQLQNKLAWLVQGLRDNPESVLVYGQRLQKDFGGPIRAVPSPQNWNPANGWGVDNGQIIYRAAAIEMSYLTFPKSACDWETAKILCKFGTVTEIQPYVCVYHWHGKNISLNRPKRENPKDFEKYFTDRFKIDWT